MKKKTHNYGRRNIQIVERSLSVSLLLTHSGLDRMREESD